MAAVGFRLSRGAYEFQPATLTAWGDMGIVSAVSTLQQLQQLAESLSRLTAALARVDESAGTEPGREVVRQLHDIVIDVEAKLAGVDDLEVPDVVDVARATLMSVGACDGAGSSPADAPDVVVSSATSSNDAAGSTAEVIGQTGSPANAAPDAGTADTSATALPAAAAAAAAAVEAESQLRDRHLAPPRKRPVPFFHGGGSTDVTPAMPLYNLGNCYMAFARALEDYSELSPSARDDSTDAAQRASVCFEHVR